MNISELQFTLRRISSDVGENIEKLHSLENQIENTINRVQLNFSDQTSGQSIISNLDSSVNSLAFSESALINLVNELQSCISRF